MQRDLTAPIFIGNVATIGPGSLTVHTVFNEATGNFEVSAIQMSIREGEIISVPPLSAVFAGKRTGQIEKAADEIPAAMLTLIENLLAKGLEAYAAQEGYDLKP